MMRIDLGLALAGYLRRPDGRLRDVRGLDRLAADTRAAGIEVCWAGSVCRHPGWYSPSERRMVLAPWLFYVVPWALRDVWTHELGHAVVGMSCEAVRAWQEERYGELLTPMMVA